MQKVFRDEINLFVYKVLGRSNFCELEVVGKYISDSILYKYHENYLSFNKQYFLLRKRHILPFLNMTENLENKLWVCFYKNMNEWSSYFWRLNELRK